MVYHFIGIKGSGMSALAIIMKKLGYLVDGSDYDKHYFTEDDLLANGIVINSFSPDNISDDQIIIRGNTFGDDNEEVMEAFGRGLMIYTYQEMVAKITNDYNLIAVSGCHGKTTTSSLLAHVMDSNYLIGDGCGNICNSDYFVLEACEYKRHFLSYNPNYVIVTNVDFDHSDYYNDIYDVLDAYNAFISKAIVVIVCGDDINANLLSHDVKYTYGINDNNFFQAKNVIYNSDGISYDFYVDKKYVFSFSLPFYGKHMVLNSLAVISLCYLEDFDLYEVLLKLQTFKGAKRRFQESRVGSNIIIDDYAHHPNEIRSVIDSVRQKYPNKRLIGVFEPHTFTRVKTFYKEMAAELSRCDYVFVMDIYKSRENPVLFSNISSQLILDNLDNGEYMKREDISKLLRYNDSVILFMSPNDMGDIQSEYKKYVDNNL